MQKQTVNATKWIAEWSDRCELVCFPSYTGLLKSSTCCMVEKLHWSLNHIRHLHSPFTFRLHTSRIVALVSNHLICLMHGFIQSWVHPLIPASQEVWFYKPQVHSENILWWLCVKKTCVRSERKQISQWEWKIRPVIGKIDWNGVSFKTNILLSRIYTRVAGLNVPYLINIYIIASPPFG